MESFTYLLMKIDRSVVTYDNVCQLNNGYLIMPKFQFSKSYHLSIFISKKSKTIHLCIFSLVVPILPRYYMQTIFLNKTGVWVGFG